jgi:glycosyltransferase involved in cell wall biosynthesis
MRVAIIGCPFAAPCGFYVDSLRSALERNAQTRVQLVASNCGCGNPSETDRRRIRDDSAYFDMVQVGEFRSSNPLKRVLRRSVRDSLYYFRAARYEALSQGADVVHLQQMLHAYGSAVTFHWLRRNSAAARVVTVHEFDPDQVEFPGRSRAYAHADAVIVLSEEMRADLIRLGVAPDRIHFVPYGTDVPALETGREREAIVFYAGHRVMVEKGTRTMFESYAILLQRLGDAAPRLRIHGQYGDEPPAEAVALARHAGVADRVEWLNTLPLDRMSRLYRDSLLLVLPYTGGFAGLPSAMAAASGLPVVATRKAAIPDHIGDCGVWIRGEDPVELADRIGELLVDAGLRDRIGNRLRQHAEQHLAWDVVGHATFDVYRQASERAQQRRGSAKCR